MLGEAFAVRLRDALDTTLYGFVSEVIEAPVAIGAEAKSAKGRHAV